MFVYAEAPLQILLDHDAKVNAADGKGQTPLHTAAVHRHPRTVKASSGVLQHTMAIALDRYSSNTERT